MAQVISSARCITSQTLHALLPYEFFKPNDCHIELSRRLVELQSPWYIPAQKFRLICCTQLSHPLSANWMLARLLTSSRQCGELTVFTVWLDEVLHPISAPCSTGYTRHVFQINEGMMPYPL